MCVSNFIAKVFGYPPKILLRRVRYYLFLKFTEFFLFPRNRIRIVYKDYIDREAFSSILERRARQLYNTLTRFQTETNKEERASNISELVKGRLQIFNYCLLDKQSNWRSDPVSGYEWRDRLWYRKGRSDLPEGTDIKRPWELSRMYFLLPVAIEYFRTGDENLADFVCECVDYWSQQNPLGTAPNWCCTMEVAVRCANITLALVLVSSASSFVSRAAAFQVILNDHIGFILTNLENISQITSNHYAANIAGLFVSLKHVPRTKNGEAALNFSRVELETEIAKQTLDDGWNFELSSSYHRLVFDFFFYSFLFSFPLEFSSKFRRLLISQCSVLNSITKPNGHIIQIGDNDSGRFLCPFGVHDLGSNFVADCINFYNKVLEFCPEKSRYKLYDHAGVYVVRTDRFFFCIKGGVKGQSGFGGHSHNDCFSFEMQFDNIDIVVDPGTGTYTADPSIRNLFRSSSVHNGVFWEGVEEARLDYGLFALAQENRVNSQVSIGGDVFRFSGRNQYRKRWHDRQVSIDLSQGTVEIVDEVSAVGAYLNFTIPAAMSSSAGNSVDCDAANFKWRNCKEVVYSSGFYSPQYGVVIDASRVVVPFEGRKITTSISFKRWH